MLAALLAAGTVKAQVVIHGNVYGGGNLADVKINTEVNMSAGQVAGNVYGGGKGKADTFTCEKAMVGVNDEGACGDPGSDDNKNKGTKVTISNGTVGTLEGEEGAQTLKEGTGNVYGGGEIGRVEWNTQVLIGVGTGEGTFAPVIYGSVFGAGKGLETHGYSALVRGNSTVTVQGNAKVGYSVYGGGEKSTVGRYWVKGITATLCSGETEPSAPTDLPDGMPYKQRSGGICSVNIKGNAEIGYNGADNGRGHVFGAGKGVEPHFVASEEGRSQKMTNTNELVDFTTEGDYLEFLQTLSLVTNSFVTIDGEAKVKGSVFGGSESGFVQHDTQVTVKGNCEIGTATYGNVFGGGKGLQVFAEAGKVKGNAKVLVEGGSVNGNVYGGGNLGDVGTITKPADYNYTWKQKDGTTANGGGTNAMTGTNNNTGTCTVTITGGTIGTAGAVDEQHGHVFGAGQGLDDTFWCEKAIAYSTAVSITGGTVFGNVYGGGQIGRVEDDAKVMIGGASAEARADIKGSVFGAGAGKDTHGYSALVRGDTKVTVEGYALVGHSVYGGGEKASVGRYGLNAQKMPNILVGGGNCDVDIQGHAAIGADVFGAGKGIDPVFDSSNKPRRMTAVNGESTWETFNDADSYFGFLETLALATHPDVTISGDATVNGSVYGGGEQGLTKGSVVVNIIGGTIEKDVYGGGALANTNTTDIVADNYPTVTPTTDTDGNIVTRTVSPTTTVNLLGGLIKGDAYGGGLGRLARAAVAAQAAQGTVGEDGYVPAVEAQPAVAAVEAKVFGDITVTLGEDPTKLSEGVLPRVTKFNITKYKGKEIVKSGRVFGCNNLNGSPQGNVTVRVWQTRAGNTIRTAEDPENSGLANKTDAVSHTYEVAAVYGGGNLASYTAAGKKTNVIVETCDASIQYVYGGGNAAAVPQTDVLIKGAYEIENVYGGGNGMDDYTLDDGSTWITNPGANVNGNANTLLTGGYVHEAYGGSNEKGTITGDVAIDVGTGGCCDLDLAKLVGAGKNADVNGDLKVVMGCKPETKVPLVFGGADNANVNGDVELTITSGNWGTVVGGNNNGGVIKGHIILNIEETSCIPINIDELYSCGYNALYSEYGYYVETEQTTGENATGVGAPTETAILTSAGKLHFLPRLSADDPHKPVNTYAFNETSNKWEWTVYTGEEGDVFTPYASPEVNIISCTHIGQVFGGGYGATATVYGDPKVNINMIPGDHAAKITRGEVTNDVNALGEIGNVFGGGNQAAVWGNTTVNIATKTAVQLHESISREGVYTMSEDKTVTGAYISGNVYGGGNEADVTGNTLVQVCAKEVEGVYQAVSQGTTGVLIAGNVYGGGKGVADVYRCPKAMVGIDGDGVTHPDGGTSVIIGNGTVGGSVYGGGEVGRVEKNTVVNIGTGDGTATAAEATSTPVIKGNVFGAGKGESTHGYAALVRGNATVSVMGNSKVMQSVYGGGEIASVGRYKVAEETTEATEHDVEVGEPYSLANQNSGKCIVTVGGYAEIGPDNMRMKKADGGPDDTGYVFGAGKGVLPYEGYADSETPWRKTPGISMTDDTDDGTENYGDANEDDYLTYIGTLALATQTDVTIKDHAFIKGSVYGGSENGRVQHDTDVKIQGHCQIGNGWDKANNTGVNARYDEAHFINPATATVGDIEEKAAILHECASWDYGVEEEDEEGVKKMVYHPYDKYSAREGASTTATDGHTFFGNVFGGGSGLYPYKSRKTGVGYEWLRTAGQVSGNTNVTITGGHILTSVYGGCELTDVGNSETLKEGKGKCTVKMSGGTLGVPRTLAQIAAHPVTCYLFGAGKGDQRVHFNQWTNVGSVEVEVSGSAIIYGSVFGGGEDGHVLGDAKVTIKENAVIGTWGTSYVDGNIFGAGRGFGGDALSAGVISGNVTVNIEGGTMLGSVYGGGRLASVGTHLVPEGNANYGKLIDNGKKQNIGKTTLDDDANATHGYVTINISGGTIGNNLEYIYPANETMTADDWTTWKTNNHIPQTEFGTATAGREDVNRLLHTRGGNVFAGAMGRLYALDGSTVLTYWADMGKARKTTVNISGGHIKSNVYGGGELGTLVEGSEIIITGGTIGTEVKDVGGNVKYLFGSVFGGGYGSAVDGVNGSSIEEGKPVTAKDHAGHVLGNTKIEMKASTGDSPTTGTVLGSIYGGGELAWVNGNTDISVSAGTIGRSDVQGSSDPKPYYVKFGGYRMGNIFGGGKGSTDYHLAGIIKGNATVSVSGGNIYHNIYGGGALGSVGTFTYDNTTNFPTACTNGTGSATVTVTGGTIGVNGWDNGIVSGSSRGDIQDIKPAEGAYDMHDKLAWVNNSVVTIGTKDVTTGPEVRCTVYGGGENGHNLGNTTVTVHSGTIGYSNDVAWECGNVFGAGCGTDVYDHAANEPFYHNPMGGLVKGTTDVTVDGGHVLRSVYGGGSMGSVEGKSTISVEGGRIGHNVFGGPEGDNEASGDPAHVAETEVNIQYATTPAADNADHTEKLIAGSVYGGGEAGLVYGTVAVNMKGGLVLSDVYGGGALAHTNTSNWSGTTWATGKTSASSTTTVSLTGGTIGGNVYGGGLGRLAKEAVAAQGTEGEGYVPAQPAVAAIEAKVYGDVQVDLNKPTTTTTGEGEGATTTTTYGDCEVQGNIFGCNNLNGSPQGGVTVHVYKTVAKENGTEKAKPAKDKDIYELTAVYGGGNLAAFYPDDETTRKTAKANVIIDGCELTSIQTVYGGGNAASVPETDVIIKGTYEIGQAFGGGNGADEYTIDGKTYENPGANVGYMSYAYHTWDATANKYMAHEYGSEAGDTKDASTKEKRVANYGTGYGAGNAHISVLGGTVHAVYAGSNTRGNIRVESRATLKDADDNDCPFVVTESYGGGKNALQDGDAVLDIDCISGMGKAYGGASNADVNGDVILNITNGTYDQVFGGNDLGGAIRGSITVNIEETGCNPIIIGELYAGGNRAPYSVYGYDVNSDGKLQVRTSGENPQKDPQLNVKSFTSIGTIYGGGYGEPATMVGNPKIYIDVVKGAYSDRPYAGSTKAIDGHQVIIPSHEAGKIGAIQNVFGGGNEAEVIGTPHVYVGTKIGEEIEFETLPKVGGAYQKKTVEGVDIRGNVYGGGNNAEVTGNTNVVIGKKTE